MPKGRCLEVVSCRYSNSIVWLTDMAEKRQGGSVEQGRSWRIWATAGVALGVLAGSAEAQISTTAWYSAVNKNSNKCVDAASGGTANGTVVQQWTCNGTTAQNWQFQTTDSGYYKV